MRRDRFRLELSNVAWSDRGDDPRQPTLAVHLDDPEEPETATLDGPLGEPLDADDVDVTFRFRRGGDGEADRGVLALADRVTGEFLFEVNAEGTALRSFVTAARRYAERTDDAARYRVQLHHDDEPVLDLEKRTLLVYSSEGELLRQHSLIPSGVEI